jgi:TolB-like protein/Tfp pilus assembly protein PilF
VSLIEELKRRNVFRVGVAYTVGAWVVLQIIDFVIDAISAPNWVVQVFILVAVIGLPVVLAISWAFELTPEGIKRESEIDRSRSIVATTGRRLDRLIIVFLTLAVVFLVGERLVRSPVETAPSIEGSSEPNDITARDNTIAVLPFVNMSSDQEQEYFSDGITEEILNRLASIRELRVAARTSVFSFKDHNEDIREIARKLGVETILEGSVRRSGDEIRITAQLIRASDGFHLWSQAYDRKLENIFAIQDDIAAQIAEAMRVSMGISDRQVSAPRTIDPEVYDLYLRARALHRQRGEVLLEAIELFEQALAIDPEFAPAWAGLSHTYIVLPNYISEEQQDSIGDILEKSLSAAERALELDPTLPSAIHALGNTLFFRFEWAAAERQYLKALEFDPDSADIMEDYVSLLTFSGQLDASRKVADRMIELDPYVAVFQNAMIALLEAQGEQELKDETIRIALEISPDLPNVQQVRFHDMLRDGRFDEARAFAHQMNTVRYDLSDFLEIIDWMEGGAQSEIGAGPALLYSPALALFAGRYDLWLESLSKARDQWPEWYISPLLELYSPIGSQETLRRFRSDVRTKAYLEELKLPEYWRQVGWPDICQPIGEDDFECS